MTGDTRRGRSPEPAAGGPELVRVIRPGHPLHGLDLPVWGRLRLRGTAVLEVVLPDGSKKRIPAAWTGAAGQEPAAGVVAPVGGVVAAAGDLLRLLRVISGIPVTSAGKAAQAARQSPGKEDNRAACTTESAAGPGSGATPAGHYREQGTPRDHLGGARPTRRCSRRCGIRPTPARTHTAGPGPNGMSTSAAGSAPAAVTSQPASGRCSSQATMTGSPTGTPTRPSGAGWPATSRRGKAPRAPARSGRAPRCCSTEAGDFPVAKPAAIGPALQGVATAHNAGVQARHEERAGPDPQLAVIADPL